MQRPDDRCERSAGFSLLELLVTIAIAGIVLAIAVPSLGGFTGESRATALANEFVSALQSARSEAIKRGVPVVLCASAAPLAVEPDCAPGADYADGWIVWVDDNGDAARQIVDAEPVLLQRGPVEWSAAFGPSAGVAARVRFDVTGAHVRDDGAPFRGGFGLRLADEKRDIVIAASGRVSSARP